MKPRCCATLTGDAAGFESRGGFACLQNVTRLLESAAIEIDGDQRVARLGCFLRLVEFEADGFESKFGIVEPIEK